MLDEFPLEQVSSAICGEVAKAEVLASNPDGRHGAIRPVPESVLTDLARALRDGLLANELFDQVVAAVSAALAPEGLSLGPTVLGELLPGRYSYRAVAHGFRLLDGSASSDLVLFLDLTLEDESACWTFRMAAGFGSSGGIRMTDAMAHGVLRGVPGGMLAHLDGLRDRSAEREYLTTLQDFSSGFATLISQALQA